MIPSTFVVALGGLLAFACAQGVVVVQGDYEATMRNICMLNSQLVCNLVPTKNSTVKGRVQFEPVYVSGACATQIRADVKGLTPMSKQAIHIHQFGDLSSTNGKSLGGHFSSPGGIKYAHGMPDSPVRHWGDFGSLEVNADGIASYKRIDNMITIPGIVGRGMVVHENADRGAKSQPSGGAGSRKAMCVIGYANSEYFN